ncbi:MAG TPA: AAA-associated domain-containing protein [Nitrososphaerales archaeon]|nr:AAA-associated domain-containing protein [Nitrososphaerales archaeon]
MAEEDPFSIDRFTHNPVMPPNVRPGQIIALVEVVGGLGSRVDVSTLADELGADIAVLLPMIDAAETLGLVTTAAGEVHLTDFGCEFQKEVKEKVTMLRERLAKIEPFRTALEFIAKRGDATAREVADELAIEGIKLHHQMDLNESLVQALLVHWGIRSGLLSYDGRDGKFRRPA